MATIVESRLDDEITVAAQRYRDPADSTLKYRVLIHADTRDGSNRRIRHLYTDQGGQYLTAGERNTLLQLCQKMVLGLATAEGVVDT